MNFIAPEFLYALGFLAIPIIIHLFNFRKYKTVKFSQVRFLKSVKKQTQSTSQLRHFLVLLSRCIAIAALVFAFAQPYLIDNNNRNVVGKKGVLVYIDNSFSMQNNAEAGSLLDAAKAKALSLLDAFSEADRFQLHTNEFKGNQERWLNKQGFINALQNVNFTPIVRATNQVMSRLNQVKNKENYIIDNFLITDLQKSNFDFSASLDSSLYHLLPVQAVAKNNVWINELSSFQPFHLPKQKEELSVTFKTSKTDQEKSFNGQLNLNKKLKSPFTFTVKEEETIEKINFNNPDVAVLTGEVIGNDYPVTFDDTFYFSYSMQAPIKVLHLFDKTPDPSLAKLYQEDSLIDYSLSSIKQIDFSLLQSTSLIIFDGISSMSSGISDELSKFVKKGGSILIFPPQEFTDNSLTTFLAQLNAGRFQQLIQDTIDVVKLNVEAPIFKDVFEEAPKQINLPRANAYWRIKSPQNSIIQSILSYRNNDLFLSSYEAEKGKVYLSSVGLSKEQSNFNEHALFVPALFNIALQSVQQKALAYELGNTSIQLDNIQQKESPVKLVRKGQEFIPKQLYRNNTLEFLLGNEIDQAGHYQLKREDEILGMLSLNYNRKESDLSLYTVDELSTKASLAQWNIDLIVEDQTLLSEKIKEGNSGKRLWKYFALLALFFFGIEILFLRILK